MWLDNFRYAYVYAAMQIYVDIPLTPLMASDFKEYTTVLLLLKYNSSNRTKVMSRSQQLYFSCQIMIFEQTR